MATTNDIKNGMVLDLDGQLWSVVWFQHHKPGKGGAMVKTTLKNIMSGKTVDKTFNAGLKIDFGARVDGYHADCTRTVVLGPADDWQREVHAAVKESQAAGLDLLREGVPVADSDAAARGVLEASGWLEAFTTGLGHGVGLEIHEDPFIAGSHPGKLVSRTVLTMEPGIYVPGRGGVRIEDTVVVTPGAPEVLTTMTKDLLEIG